MKPSDFCRFDFTVWIVWFFRAFLLSIAKFREFALTALILDTLCN